MKLPPRIPRRTFLGALGAAGLAAPWVTRRLLAAPPSGVQRHASFGTDGMAFVDLQAIAADPAVQLVAVADVDLPRAAAVRKLFPQVRVYQDWRELLDREHANLDSVNVSVPDHMHAPMAMAALQLGKHVYGQKPLAHDLYETRRLAAYARERGLVTQMGIQIHSQAVYRQAVALVQQGAIGRIREVHLWCNKKWGDLGAPPAAGDAVPDGFDWDLWQGGCERRPFVGGAYYHPNNWRKRLDFGTGTFGDMGCHIFDPVFEALALTAPLSVRSDGPPPDAWNWPINARIRYVFPGTRFTAESTLAATWYDGDQLPPEEVRALVTEPPAAAEAAKGRKPGLPESGSILVGTKGTLLIPHIAPPRLFPTAQFKDFPLPAAEDTDHWLQWTAACRGRGAPSASFAYAGPLTETVLLGSVAVRFPQTTLAWDAAKLAFGLEAANRFVRRTYRSGWSVAGL